MSWIGWTLLVLFILWVVGSLGSKNSKRTTSTHRQKRGGSGERDIEAEAKEIASGITTIQQFRALQKKVVNAEKRISEAGPSKSFRGLDNAYDKHLTLLGAERLAATKTLAWQFIPDLDLNTPMFALNNAYKVFSSEEHKRLRDTTLTDWSAWRGMDGYSEKEEPDGHLKALRKFRSIVESDLTQEQMVKRINKLVSNEYEYFDDYFGLPDGMQPGDEWFAEKLAQDGLPQAYQLYSEGYTTAEKCLEVDPDAFRMRKGVGPEEVEKLKQFQLKTKEASIDPGHAVEKSENVVSDPGAQ